MPRVAILGILITNISMAITLPNTREFVPSHQSNVHDRWAKWISCLKNLLVVLFVKEAECQRALLLHYIGKPTLDIFDTLLDSGGEKDIKDGIDALSNYFSPRESVGFNIFTLHLDKLLNSHMRQ